VSGSLACQGEWVNQGVSGESASGESVETDGENRRIRRQVKTENQSVTDRPGCLDWNRMR
jgi:hypothetical protein